MTPRSAALLTGDFGARRILVHGGNGDEWTLARTLLAAGAEQIDLCFDNLRTDNIPVSQVLAAQRLDPVADQAIRIIITPYLEFWAADRLGRYDAFLVRELQYFRDPLEPLVHAHGLDVGLLCVEAALVPPFTRGESGEAFELLDGDRVRAERLSVAERRAFANHFARIGLDMPQFDPHRAATTETGLLHHHGMWRWLMTPGGVDDLLLRAGWTPNRQSDPRDPLEATWICHRVGKEMTMTTGRCRP